jgi:hypothetical protein
MGYDLHITRAKDWSQNDGRWITAEEWLNVVAQDAELHLDGVNGPYFAIWSGRSTLDQPWLDWFRGNITTKDPDAALVDKMIAIAEKLNAQVQGDDGEEYLGGRTDNSLSP